jgi:hypothetical protein
MRVGPQHAAKAVKKKEERKGRDSDEYSQVVKSGCHVPHQGHEEQGHLEDIVLNKVEAIDQRIVPRGAAHVHDE